MTKLTRRLWNFLYRYHIEPEVITIDEVSIEEAAAPPQPKKRQTKRKVSGYSTEITKRVLVVTINIVLSIVFVGSFIFMVAAAFRDINIPEVIPNAFIATLGYFGGVLTSFFGLSRIS